MLERKDTLIVELNSIRELNAKYSFLDYPEQEWSELVLMQSDQ